VDEQPGDRRAGCGGLMVPVAMRRGRKRMLIEHRCSRCGFRRANRVAERTDQPDDIEKLVELAAGS
jgi:hypothetical protein